LLAQLLEERKPDHAPQLLDLHRHRGLAQVQLLGGAGEALLAGDGFEHLELAKGEVQAGN
jgi:hypothetical protein